MHGQNVYGRLRSETVCMAGFAALPALLSESLTWPRPDFTGKSSLEEAHRVCLKADLAKEQETVVAGTILSDISLYGSGVNNRELSA